MVKHVGPVLQKGSAANAIVQAIEALNSGVHLVDRGSYVRVLVPQRCVLTRTAIEEVLGERFELPADLELVMSSFSGNFIVSTDSVCWECSV